MFYQSLVIGKVTVEIGKHCGVVFPSIKGGAYLVSAEKLWDSVSAAVVDKRLTSNTLAVSF